jgi:hypothetical protein
MVSGIESDRFTEIMHHRRIDMEIMSNEDKFFRRHKFAMASMKAFDAELTTQILKDDVNFKLFENYWYLAVWRDIRVWRHRVLKTHQEASLCSKVNTVRTFVMIYNNKQREWKQSLQSIRPVNKNKRLFNPPSKFMGLLSDPTYGEYSPQINFLLDVFLDGNTSTLDALRRKDTELVRYTETLARYADNKEYSEFSRIIMKALISKASSYFSHDRICWIMPQQPETASKDGQNKEDFRVITTDNVGLLLHHLRKEKGEEDWFRQRFGTGLLTASQMQELNVTDPYGNSLKDLYIKDDVRLARLIRSSTADLSSDLLDSLGSADLFRWIAMSFESIPNQTKLLEYLWLRLLALKSAFPMSAHRSIVHRLWGLILDLPDASFIHNPQLFMTSLQILALKDHSTDLNLVIKTINKTEKSKMEPLLSGKFLKHEFPFIPSSNQIIVLFKEGEYLTRVDVLRPFKKLADFRFRLAFLRRDLLEYYERESDSAPEDSLIQQFLREVKKTNEADKMMPSYQADRRRLRQLNRETLKQVTQAGKRSLVKVDLNAEFSDLADNFRLLNVENWLFLNDFKGTRLMIEYKGEQFSLPDAALKNLVAPFELETLTSLMAIHRSDGFFLERMVKRYPVSALGWYVQENEPSVKLSDFHISKITDFIERNPLCKEVTPEQGMTEDVWQRLFAEIQGLDRRIKDDYALLSRLPKWPKGEYYLFQQSIFVSRCAGYWSSDDSTLKSLFTDYRSIKKEFGSLYEAYKKLEALLSILKGEKKEMVEQTEQMQPVKNDKKPKKIKIARSSSKTIPVTEVKKVKEKNSTFEFDSRDKLDLKGAFRKALASQWVHCEEYRPELLAEIDKCYEELWRGEAKAEQRALNSSFSDQGGKPLEEDYLQECAVVTKYLAQFTVEAKYKWLVASFEQDYSHIVEHIPSPKSCRPTTAFLRSKMDSYTRAFEAMMAMRYILKRTNPKFVLPADNTNLVFDFIGLPASIIALAHQCAWGYASTFLQVHRRFIPSRNYIACLLFFNQMVQRMHMLFSSQPLEYSLDSCQVFLMPDLHRKLLKLELIERHESDQESYDQEHQRGAIVTLSTYEAQLEHYWKLISIEKSCHIGLINSLVHIKFSSLSYLVSTGLVVRHSSIREREWLKKCLTYCLDNSLEELTLQFEWLLGNFKDFDFSPYEIKRPSRWLSEFKAQMKEHMAELTVSEELKVQCRIHRLRIENGPWGIKSVPFPLLEADIRNIVLLRDEQCLLYLGEVLANKDLDFVFSTSDSANNFKNLSFGLLQLVHQSRIRCFLACFEYLARHLTESLSLDGSGVTRLLSHIFNEVHDELSICTAFICFNRMFWLRENLDKRWAKLMVVTRENMGWPSADLWKSFDWVTSVRDSQGADYTDLIPRFEVDWAAYPTLHLLLPEPPEQILPQSANEYDSVDWVLPITLSLDALCLEAFKSVTSVKDKYRPTNATFVVQLEYLLHHRQHLEEHQEIDEVITEELCRYRLAYYLDCLLLIYQRLAGQSDSQNLELGLSQRRVNTLLKQLSCWLEDWVLEMSPRDWELDRGIYLCALIYIVFSGFNKEDDYTTVLKLIKRNRLDTHLGCIMFQTFTLATNKMIASIKAIRFGIEEAEMNRMKLNISELLTALESSYIERISTEVQEELLGEPDSKGRAPFECCECPGFSLEEVRAHLTGSRNLTRHPGDEAFGAGRGLGAGLLLLG